MPFNPVINKTPKDVRIGKYTSTGGNPIEVWVTSNGKLARARPQDNFYYFLSPVNELLLGYLDNRGVIWEAWVLEKKWIVRKDKNEKC